MRAIFSISSLAICVSALLLIIGGCSDSQRSAQKKIDTIARNIQEELPKILDSDTKLVKVYTKKLELVSEYELVNFKAPESNIGETKLKIEVYLQKKVCPGIREQLLNRGVSTRYIYKGSDGQLIGDWLIKPGDC